jgi:hypothetical protein
MTLEQIKSIESILSDAAEWGLKDEVEMYGMKYMKEIPDIDPVEAYIYAYEDWVK